MNKITMSSFGPDNRTKWVGNSQYQVCKRNDKWYITETRKDDKSYTMYDAFFTYELNLVLDTFNRIKKEFEVAGAVAEGKDKIWGGV